MGRPESPKALVARQGLVRKKLERLCDELNLPAPGRVVIAVACWSAEQLGRALTDSPARVGAYIGWLDDISVPGNDKPLREAVSAGLKALADGRSVMNCAAEMRAGFETAHDTYGQGVGNHLAKMQASYWADRMFVGGDSTRTVV